MYAGDVNCKCKNNGMLSKDAGAEQRRTCVQDPDKQSGLTAPDWLPMASSLGVVAEVN